LSQIFSWVVSSAFQEAAKCIKIQPMNMRHHARAGVALAAAYAVALQAILVAVGVPVGGAGELAALPICSALGSAHSAPDGQTHSCLGACLGCCCGTPVCPTSGPAFGCAPLPLHIVAATLTPPLLLLLPATGAHRSRAPPFA
jgi:hypothetical protein